MPQRILVDITDQCRLSRDAKEFCSDDKCGCDAQITEVNFPVDYRILLLIREGLWWKIANGFTGVSQILGRVAEIDKEGKKSASSQASTIGAVEDFTELYCNGTLKTARKKNNLIE